MESVRASRIAKLFDSILNGKTRIAPHNSTLFLEGMRTQPSAVQCLHRLDSSSSGKDALQASFWFNLTPAFINEHAAPAFHYMMDDPNIASVNNGKLLQEILLKIVEPPIFWAAFCRAFREDNALSAQAQTAFAWLLLQLVSLPEAASATFRQDQDFDRTLKRLLESDNVALCTFGHKIKHATDVYKTGISNAMGHAGSTPGGRHDNDFADFREIAIVPTPGEMECAEDPFLRPSDYLHDADTEDNRVAIHLDNQFRLLREDMLYELREELQVVQGKQKRKFQCTKITGLTATGLYFQEDPRGPPGPKGPSKARFTKCGLELKCDEDLPIFANVEAKNRVKCLRDDRNFLKHQSLACLLSDQDIIAFVTINRDEARLTKAQPVITVQLEGRKALQKLFPRLKASTNLTLIQINTALFAYEFVLKALQQTRQLPLSEELLLWKEGGVPSELDSAEQALEVVHALRRNPSCNLQTLLNTNDVIRLDASQANSLLAGLVNRVSLIQGPPGTTETFQSICLVPIRFGVTAKGDAEISDARLFGGHILKRMGTRQQSMNSSHHYSGTGKSFLGALMAKAIHDYTQQTILVICFTNHALDDILTSLLDIGIPESSMVRLGGKSTPRTESLTMRQQGGGYKRSRMEWETVDGIKMTLAQLGQTLSLDFNEYLQRKITLDDILDHIQFEDGDFFEAFVVPVQGDGMKVVGTKGRAVDATYLLQRWMKGENAGVFSNSENVVLSSDIWEMEHAKRTSKFQEWHEALDSERAANLYATLKTYNERHASLEEEMAAADISVLSAKRVIGCTTSAAAKYGFSIRAAAPDVVLVEEAGEILESHILTALAPNLSQLILIGDHKQLRPKVNNYELTVEKDNGYDLNCSLFERLIKSGYPHEVLTKQHRMRPEISDLIRQLTYPDLEDAPRTQNRPSIKGVQDNIVFIDHSHPEGAHNQLADKKDMASKASKQNPFEVEMVLKIVRYLGQQGYGTDNLVVLTPYLGQLHRLRDALKKENDPILNDLDSYELVQAGLLSPAAAKLNKKPIRLATIGTSFYNYQGEESDIVIISLTRSNSSNDIGFMYSPERLNVLLSRARNGLIMIGNSSTFKGSRKGKELWTKLFALLSEGGHIYEGFPTSCQRHPDRKASLSNAAQFGEFCPDGGCVETCGTMLNCGIHTCQLKCHGIADHSKIQCEEAIEEKCDNGHPKTRKCYQPTMPTCRVCDFEAKKARERLLRETKEREDRERAEQEHLKEIADVEAEIEREVRRRKEAKDDQDRANALRQKQADLVAVKALADLHVGSMSTPVPQAEPEKKETTGPNSSPSFLNTLSNLTSGLFSTGVAGSNAQATPPTQGRQPPSVAPPTRPPAAAEFDKRPPSKSVTEWQRQKRVEGAFSTEIDAIMAMVGLEAVKFQVLAIKAKIDTAKRQGSSLAKERFNISFLGNPGTGKTTIARLYSSFLSTVGVIPGKEFVETTGSRLGYEGVPGADKMLKDVLKAGGGSIFIDEAYQLTNGNNPSGGQVLDFLLAEMENNVGKIVFILAGYNKEMETFFEHNPGLPSRVPFKIKFEDYTNCELMDMFENLLNSAFKGKMSVEDGYRGLYSRIAIRRLGRRREASGFGNARDLQILFGQVKERQAIRLTDERREGKQPGDFLFKREDIIGPDPSTAITKSKAWGDLQGMIGLGTVKESVQNIVDSIEENYQRELSEQKPLAFSLNRVFLGSPGTGKTTVAKLYGQILADLGLLSKGEVVVKNPSDFTGSVLGESEKNTKGILNNSVGKVLVIDEAYMLYGGGGDDAKSQNNQFKTSVIDTIVAEVQNVPGDDRCVLLLGYEQQMIEMFNNVNPGLARRFKVEEAFKFEDFTEPELLKIMEKKMAEQDVGATDPAKEVALGLLSRAKNRPNFGNGGEVENLLSKAKEQCLSRRSKMRLKDRPKFIIFEPEDFDKEHNRAKNASANLAKLFEDIVGHTDIVARLASYQRVAQTCRDTGRDPRNQVPTNFVFTGPPGTGKTTIARKMGSVYYDMGFLSSAEVIECSASDLVGQYVGQTGPKTKKLFEKALGKVLFIDEAYRLGQGHFAQEAVDELVGLLTNETYKGKIIVILAGYEHEMNGLMKVNTGLSSRFPEWVPFENLSTKACIDIVVGQLKKGGVVVQELLDEQSSVYLDMTDAIDSLSNLPDWGNARDMVTMSKGIVNFALLNNGGVGSTLLVAGEDAVGVANKMLQERFKRSQVQPKVRASASDLPQMSSTATPPAPPPIGVGTGTNAPKSPPPKPSVPAQKQPAGPPADGNVRGFGARGRGRGRGRPPQPGPRMTPPQTPGTPTRSSTPISGASGTVTGAPQRDPGVSDQIWSGLQAAKRAAEDEAQRKKDEIARLNKRAADAEKKARQQKQIREQMEKQLAQEKEAARRAELEKQKRAAEEQERRIREERERIAKILKAAQQAEAERKRKEEAVQQKLRSLGICPAGYQWIAQGGGYRCSAGGHFVSAAQLGL